jgi:hypothetical protein
MPHADPVVALAYWRGYRARNREKLRLYHKKRYHEGKSAHLSCNYGISRAEFDKMAEEQAGRCAVCDTVPQPTSDGRRTLGVDHDHATGKVRALLCTTCNLGLGAFRDDPELLRMAADYLEAHRV